MNPDAAALIACESVLEPILEQLTVLLEEHSATSAGPVAEVLERLRATAADASLTISDAILESLGPIPPEPLFGPPVVVMEQVRTLSRVAQLA